MSLTFSAWQGLPTIERANLHMAALLYEGCLILASSDRVETTGKWTIWVGVYWSSGGRRERKVFSSFTNIFDTKDEAENFGFQIAKEWIDKGKPD